MSEQAETSASTSLEEVFNSREFGRVVGVEEVVVTKEFGAATRFAAPVLRKAVVGLSEPPFEEVLYSARAGRSLTLVSPLPPETQLGIAMPAEDASVTALDTRRPERNRYRAVAAVSGIAAAALVVAGITSGTVQQRRPSEVSAQGARLSSGAGSAAPGGPTPTATLSAAAGSSAAGGDSPLPAGDDSLPVANASEAHVTLSGPATTSGTAVPSPTAASGGAPAGAGGEPGSSPPPPPAGSSPVTQVMTAVGSSVGAAEASVTAVADQLGGSIPSAAPNTSALGAVTSSIG